MIRIIEAYKSDSDHFKFIRCSLLRLSYAYLACFIGFAPIYQVGLVLKTTGISADDWCVSWCINFRRYQDFRGTTHSIAFWRVCICLNLGNEHFSIVSYLHYSRLQPLLHTRSGLRLEFSLFSGRNANDSFCWDSNLCTNFFIFWFFWTSAMKSCQAPHRDVGVAVAWLVLKHGGV